MAAGAGEQSSSSEQCEADRTERAQDRGSKQQQSEAQGMSDGAHVKQEEGHAQEGTGDGDGRLGKESGGEQQRRGGGGLQAGLPVVSGEHPDHQVDEEPFAELGDAEEGMRREMKLAR